MALLLAACGASSDENSATPTPSAAVSQTVVMDASPAVQTTNEAPAPPAMPAAEQATPPPIATATPIPPASRPPNPAADDKSVTVVVKPDAEGLRFRVRPSTTGEIATYLNPNTRLLAHARSADGVWLRVTLNTSAEGYVMAQFVSGDISQLPVFDAAQAAPPPGAQNVQALQTAIVGQWFLAWWPFSDVNGNGRPLANTLISGLGAEMDFGSDGRFATAGVTGRYEVLDSANLRITYEGEATPYVFQVRQVEDGLLLLGQSREGQGLYRRKPIDFGNQRVLGRWSAQSNLGGVEGLEDMPAQSTIEFNSNGVAVIQRRGGNMQIFQFYWVDEQRLRLIQGSVDNSLVPQVSVSGETMTMTVNGNAWVFKRS
ncbi:MAG: SH3 domain-containing protein [Anaerolineae bacterium]|nr:SH3 domain-containing protein [Anaerolineae bacterium]